MTGSPPVTFTCSGDFFAQERLWRISDGEFTVIVPDSQYRRMGEHVLRVWFRDVKQRSAPTDGENQT